MMQKPPLTAGLAVSVILTASHARSQEFVTTLEGELYAGRTQLTAHNRLVAAGDRAVVSNPIFPNSSTSNVGHAWIYKRSQGGWQLTQELSPPAGLSNLGNSLDLDIAQGRLAVGWRTRVEIYELSGDRFELDTTLLTPCTGSNPHFGSSVCSSGELLAVGDIGCNTAHVYRLIGSAWTHEATFQHGDQFSTFGLWIAIEGEHLAVSHSASPGFGLTHHFVRTYQRIGGTWTATGVLPGYATTGPCFDIEGTRLLTVGGPSPYTSDTRFGLLYEWDGAAWVESSNFGPLPRTSDVDLEGDRAVISTSEDVRIFEPVAGGWVRQDVVATDGYGAVALDSPHLLIGSLYTDGRVDAWLTGLQWTSFCSGDGSGGACPCGNEAPPGSGRGCINSTGAGVTLEAAGSTSIAEDDLELLATNLPAHQPVLFFAGPDSVAGGQGLPLADGLRCVGGSVQRLAIVSAGSGGAAVLGPGVAGLVGWQAGTLQRVQAWYRDPVGGSCGSGANLSNALELILTP